MMVRDKYFWIVDLLRSKPNESYYCFSPSLIRTVEEVPNTYPFNWGGYGDEHNYRSTPEMIKQGISYLNNYYYNCQKNGWKEHEVTKNEMNLMEELLMLFGGLFGFLPTMDAYISPESAEKFVYRQNVEYDKVKQAYMEGKGFGPSSDKKLKMSDLQMHLLKNSDIERYKRYAMEKGFTDVEIEKFIIWVENERYSFDGFKELAEIVRLTANAQIHKGELKEKFPALHAEYVGLMAYLPILYRFGIDYKPDMDFKIKIADRVTWQLKEIQYFIHLCFRLLPSKLAHEPVKVASGFFDEAMKVERTQQDLVNEKAIELSSLPRFMAYAKITNEYNGAQTVLTNKIQTIPLPPK
jgi:hypothetical protein